MVIGALGDHLIFGIFGMLPRNVYYVIYHIIESIYIICAVIVGVILLAHIFKVRYLDYYDIVDNDKLLNSNEKDIEEFKTDDKNIIHLKKDKEKIVIRDPKHTGYKFINGLAKCILLIIKFFALWIILFFAITLISLVMLDVISFLFVKTGLLFLGIILILVSCIIINIIILYILYNFIVNKKNKIRMIGMSILISLIVMGIGVGLIFIGIKDFNIISEVDDINIMKKTINLDMSDDLIIVDFYNVEFIPNDREDIEIDLIYTKYSDINMFKENNIVSFEINRTDNPMNIIRNQIDDINNKKYLDYFNYKIKIYGSNENLSKLFSNIENYYRRTNYINYSD